MKDSRRLHVSNQGKSCIQYLCLNHHSKCQMSLIEHNFDSTEQCFKNQYVYRQLNLIDNLQHYHLISHRGKSCIYSIIFCLRFINLSYFEMGILEHNIKYVQSFESPRNAVTCIFGAYRCEMLMHGSGTLNTFTISIFFFSF